MEKALNTEEILTSSILTDLKYLQSDALGIIGISPFSSFFTYENILTVTKLVHDNCFKYKIFIPDLPTVYSLQSMGYEEEKAKKKASKQCRYLKNKCEKALHAINRHVESNTIVDYDHLLKNPVFQEKLNELIILYNVNKAFSEACDSFSEEFLTNKGIVASKVAIRFSSMYLIYELPMFIYADQLFDSKYSFFMYPNCPSFVRDILKEALIIGVSSEQDFIEYKIWR
jgi:cyclo(L-tyrosyl-L-tyrosyl) synthase